MTDETPDEALTEGSAVDTIEPETPADAVEAEGVAPVAVAPAEPVPFWHRPNVERYVAPLVTPIAVVLGLVIFVLNVSRIFLSGHGNIPTVVGSVITVLILVGATVLSNSARLRSQTIAFVTAGFVLVVLTSGWLVLGHSQEKGEGSEPLTAAGPVTVEAPIVFKALATIKFAPVKLTIPKTGLYSVSLLDESTGHTLDFDDPSTRFAGLVVNTPGEEKTTRIFFGEPGDYTFFCAIPGHRSSGMEGVITVEGDPITYEEAVAAGKPAAGAAGETAPAE
jgi:plastocyanin